jgi:hypothetical protein
MMNFEGRRHVADSDRYAGNGGKHATKGSLVCALAAAMEPIGIRYLKVTSLCLVRCINGT